MLKLSNHQIALITGASRGIGQAIALQLGKAGATIIGTATSQAGADSISSYLKKNNIKGYGLSLDVTSMESCIEITTYITNNTGHPQILVNNAGITKDNIMLRMKEDEWQSTIDTNLSSVYRMTKCVLRGMTKARWGRIINISSVVGSMGNIGQANYAATKAGVEGFTRALAKEVGSRNITVNAIAPGFIDTDMTKKLPEEQKNNLLKHIPISRLGTPEEIAMAVLFFANESAGYITGETLHINGGMYMK